MHGGAPESHWDTVRPRDAGLPGLRAQTGIKSTTTLASAWGPRGGAWKCFGEPWGAQGCLLAGCREGGRWLGLWGEPSCDLQPVLSPASGHSV